MTEQEEAERQIARKEKLEKWWKKHPILNWINNMTKGGLPPDEI